MYNLMTITAQLNQIRINVLPLVRGIRAALTGRLCGVRWAAAARSMASLLAAQTEWYRQRMRQLPTSEPAPLPPAATTGQ